MVVCVCQGPALAPLSPPLAWLPLRIHLGLCEGGRVILLGWEPYAVDSLLLLPPLWRGEAQRWAVLALGLARAPL